MTLRTGHGNGAGVPRVEVLPPDELPAPVPALPEPPERNPDGTFANAAAASKFAQRGGYAKARRIRLIDSLGLTKLVEGSEFSPYRSAAEEFVTHHLERLALSAGGEVGAAPSSMVASAALQLAASRWAFDKGSATGDAAMMKMGSTLANDSRQNLLAAYELAVREAQTRPKGNAIDRLRGRITNQ